MKKTFKLLIFTILPIFILLIIIFCIDIIKTDIKMNSMLLLNFIQNSDVYNVGFGIGYILGILVPFIILGAIIYFAFKYFKNKSKK